MADTQKLQEKFDDLLPASAPDNGGNGASDAPIQDNGTHGATFSVGGMPSVSRVDYPLPKDPHAPHAIADLDIMTRGVASNEVGYNGNQMNYGEKG